MTSGLHAMLLGLLMQCAGVVDAAAGLMLYLCTMRLDGWEYQTKALVLRQEACIQRYAAWLMCRHWMLTRSNPANCTILTRYPLCFAGALGCP